MFESTDKLRRDVAEMLATLRELGAGRYAAVFDAKSVIAESPDETTEAEWPLRRMLQSQAASLLRVPGALHGGEEMGDPFAELTEDEFLLAVANGKGGVLVACQDAARLEADSGRLLRALFDRLLRLQPGWRVDDKGRGLFFGSPRLDTVVIPRPDRQSGFMNEK
jgi:hypothetical protein